MYIPVPLLDKGASLPNQILCSSVISLNMEAGCVVQVKRPQLEMVAACSAVSWCLALEKRNASYLRD